MDHNQNLDRVAQDLIGDAIAPVNDLVAESAAGNRGGVQVARPGLGHAHFLSALDYTFAGSDCMDRAAQPAAKRKPRIRLCLGWV